MMDFVHAAKAYNISVNCLTFESGSHDLCDSVKTPNAAILPGFGLGGQSNSDGERASIAGTQGRATPEILESFASRHVTM